MHGHSVRDDINSINHELEFGNLCIFNFRLPMDRLLLNFKQRWAPTIHLKRSRLTMKRSELTMFGQILAVLFTRQEAGSLI